MYMRKYGMSTIILKGGTMKIKTMVKQRKLSPNMKKIMVQRE